MTLSTSVSPRSRHRFFRRITFGLGLLAALALANSTSQSQAAQISFHQVGLPDAVSSWYQHISADGSTVIGSSQTQTGQQMPFVWRADTGIVGLGTLGGNWSSANAISADGSTVVGNSATPSGNYQAFVWTADTGLVGLGTLGGNYSAATAISADGSTVVGSSATPTSQQQAFVWTADTGIIGLGTLDGNYSWARAISADGSTVIGQSQTPSGNSHAFVWTANTGLVGLSLGGNWSSATAVSADGSTVIGSSQTQTGQQQAFVWTADTGIVGLSLGGNDSWASAISADGLTVVGESQTPAGNYQAFVWTAASDIVGLPTEPGWNSWAADVSEVSSRIVGEIWDWNGFGEAVLWDHLHGMRSVTDILTDSGVDVGGFRLASAQRISRDGSTIVGAGQTAEGRWSAWVAVLPVNDPPVAIASIVVDGVDEGTSVELPCDDHEGVTVTLDGSGSHDRDGDDLEYEWSVAEDSGIVIGDPTDAITDVQFPVGVHEVTLTVFDLDENGNRRGTLDVTAVQVVVIDETPPVALVTADLVALWPANNKLVPVEVTVFASDQCTDPDDLLVFCTITSSQPDDSDGTGKLVGDVDGFDGYSAAVDITLTNHGDGTYSTVVWLRAERDGNDKAGRVYSINATAIDWSGNVGNASSTVIVPHSQAGGKK